MKDGVVVTRNVTFPVKTLCASAEEIPLEDESVDTVFSTFTFCTIPDLPRSLEEMRRVLRPGGQILFCEHGLSPDSRMAARQHRHEVWYHKRMYQGCYMTREIPQTIEAAGFEINIEYEGHLPLRLPRPWVYGWYGTARPPQ